MNIKSLLLGSAAALVAVSGARAADAVVIAEPEPVEYVRVCDVFGTGFFYIPGTETCLKFDGYVRYRIGANEDIDGFYKRTRVRLNVDARSETELGTLRGFARFQADWGNGATGSNGTVTVDGPVGIDQAIVQLGGFYAGYTESAFAAPWGLPGPARFGIMHTDDGGSYGYQQRHQLGYIFNGGNGFFGSIVLEDDNHLGDTVLPPELRNFGESDGYVPDVVGTIGLSQAWGAVWGGLAFDESASEYGLRAGLQWNVPNAPGSSLRFGGWYASDPNAYAIDMPLAGLAEWSIAASYHQQFTPEWGAELGLQYMNSFDDPAFGGDADGYWIEGAVIWVPVTNFEVRLEGHWYQQDDVLQADGTLSDDETWDGFLWFTRYF
ncbi:porin [Mesorhizobium xinjiangense]|uniref:porin n=1 Tax=Mesorhizobium xinjiangense TaxID=2678685 RepID=UPI0038B32A08